MTLVNSGRRGQKAGVRRMMWLALAVTVMGFVGWRTSLWRYGRQHRYDALIREVAEQHRLPAELVKAVIWRESRFDPDARGGAGELGLMQVTEAAAQEWADARRDRSFEARHLLHPATNLHAGCFYLAKVTRRYLRTDHPYAYALADYNAGRGNVLRWMNDAGATNASVFLNQMTFPGTRDYVRSILDRTPAYRDDFPTANRP